MNRLARVRWNSPHASAWAGRWRVRRRDGAGRTWASSKKPSTACSRPESDADEASGGFLSKKFAGSCTAMCAVSDEHGYEHAHGRPTVEHTDRQPARAAHEPALVAPACIARRASMPTANGYDTKARARIARAVTLLPAALFLPHFILFSGLASACPRRSAAQLAAQRRRVCGFQGGELRTATSTLIGRPPSRPSCLLGRISHSLKPGDTTVTTLPVTPSRIAVFFWKKSFRSEAFFRTVMTTQVFLKVFYEF
jgi:hypothetical protein